MARIAGIDLPPLRLERREVEDPAEFNGNRREQQQFRDDIHHGDHGEREGEFPPSARRSRRVGVRRGRQEGLSRGAGRMASPEEHAVVYRVANLPVALILDVNHEREGQRRRLALDERWRRGGNRCVKSCGKRDRSQSRCDEGSKHAR